MQKIGVKNQNKEQIANATFEERVRCELKSMLARCSDLDIAEITIAQTIANGDGGSATNQKNPQRR